MTKIGYAAMLEQFHPTDLLDWCAQAEAAGFSAGFMVSEHFHPWTPQQGQSAFAWALHGRPRPAHVSCRFGTGGHVPRLPLPPGGDRPCGGDARGDVPGPLLARASAPARRSTSTSSAATGRRSASARRCCSRRSRSSTKLFSGKVVRHRGRALQGGERPPVHAARAARADLRRDGRARSTPRRPAGWPTG